MSRLTDDAKIKDDVRLCGPNLLLRPVTLADVTDTYIQWMNDPEVNQYMETRFRSQGRDDVEAYVRNAGNDPNSYFFAMLYAPEDRHIGNIKLGLISAAHKRGDISLWIGDRSFRGRGLATEAIVLVRDFACQTLGLHKLRAGCYENNIGSARAFEKAGFIHEATQKHDFICRGQYVDRWWFSFFCRQ